MAMLFVYRPIILLLLGQCLLMIGACSRINELWHPTEPSTPVSVSSTASPTPESSTTPTPTPTPTPSPQLSPAEAYQRAIDAAYSAGIIAESAQAPDDWQLAIARWQEAIDLLKSIPSSSPQHKDAQAKITDYQRRLNGVKQQASRPNPASPTPITLLTRPLKPSEDAPESKTDSANSNVVKAPIKRRIGQTPVISVTFNQKQTFEMVVDTGATTTLITPAMGKSLGIVAQGEITADTASDQGVKFSTATVQSIAVGPAVQQDFSVAIGNDDLELGLLGQDFFSHYDMVIRQDVIELHLRE